MTDCQSMSVPDTIKHKTQNYGHGEINPINGNALLETNEFWIYGWPSPHRYDTNDYFIDRHTLHIHPFISFSKMSIKIFNKYSVIDVYIWLLQPFIMVEGPAK